MKLVNTARLWTVAAGAAALLIAAAVAQQNENTLSHTVRKGETVSLLCIHYYGHYSPKLAAGFLALNPGVKDINLISVGQLLTFRRPVEPGTPPPPGLPAEEAKLYEQNVRATQGVVTYVEGAAWLTGAASGKKERLAANVIVFPGDVIQTGGDGRVELIINRETVVRMKDNTKLTVSALRDLGTDKGRTKTGLSVGTVWTRMKKFKDRISRFELELPTAIAGVHGTVYQTSVAKDSSADVMVFDGEVAVSGMSAGGPPAEAGLDEVAGPEEVPGPEEVTMERWTQIVRSMQKLHIDRKGKASLPQDFVKKQDDSWQQWNEERDKRIAEMLLGI